MPQWPRFQSNPWAFATCPPPLIPPTFLFSPPYHYPIKAKMAKNIMSAYNSPSLVVHRRWLHKGMYIVSNNIQVDRHVEAVWPLSCDLWHQQHILTRSLAIFSLFSFLVKPVRWSCEGKPSIAPFSEMLRPSHLSLTTI